MSFAQFDAAAVQDDSALSTLVMARLTTQLLAPDVSATARRPRRTRQRPAPDAVALHHGRLQSPAIIVPIQTKTTSVAAPMTTPTPTGFTARPREATRVWLESVWWTARTTEAPSRLQATTSSLPITA